MATSFINHPEHWHNRAEEARNFADQMNDEVSTRIAADYERLAESHAARTGRIDTPDDEAVRG